MTQLSVRPGVALAALVGRNFRSDANAALTEAFLCVA